MHVTIVSMKLARPNPVGGTLKEHITFLEKQIAAMNDITSAYNQKKVEIIESDEDENVILLKVTSEIALEQPGRAFTGLSRSLLDETAEGYDPYFAQNLYNSRLLSFDKIREDEEEIIKVTDEELIHRVVTLVMKSKGTLTKTEKDALFQMKKIVGGLNSIVKTEN